MKTAVLKTTVLRTTVVDRFLDYVRFDTRSDEVSSTYPSTQSQKVLLRHLRDQLIELGLDDVEMDDYGYVTATVPATTDKQNVPVIGFVAHVDTSPEMPGDDVRPVVHPNYDGSVITFADDPELKLDPALFPDLEAAKGHDIITASGRTLLGADDKCGVAELIAAAEFLIQHPEITHGKIRLAFTPDEEIGRGTDYFDTEKFGAQFAYTLDGGGHGYIESETFSADSMTVRFLGFNTHPGYAKGKMVNAIKVAADFIHRLPSDSKSPETTSGYEGYVHPNSINAAVDRTEVDFIIRDFDTAKLAELEQWLEDLARQTAADWPNVTVEVEVTESYRNMRQVIDQHPEILRIAEQAMERAGLEPHSKQIRGGTDGSRLSFMGLPTPNLSSGQHNIHSRLEWADTWEMEKAVEVMIEICKLFEQRA